MDFEHDYKTLDLDFMESVWWVFRRLWDQGLIYRDFKVLPYSYGAATPLSNFEANMDYRDVEDPSLTLRLEVTRGPGPGCSPGTILLVWTTTPWTLPANLGVAVGAGLRYVRVDAPRSAGTPAATGSPPTWSARTGRTTTCTSPPRPPAPTWSAPRYRPALRLLRRPSARAGPSWSSPATNVVTDEGTGLVHMAPAYGEADFFALAGGRPRRSWSTRSTPRRGSPPRSPRSPG